MPKSKHSQFVFLDYTFRPAGGISSFDLDILHSSFTSVAKNPKAKQGIFAVEVCHDKAGSLIGTRHVHIRLEFKEPVEPYRAFKYQLEGKYKPFRKHMRYITPSIAQRKFGYCMKDQCYKWLFKPKSETFANVCWQLYEEEESLLQADISKLIQVTKNNLLPLMLQYTKETWPTTNHRNWRECIISMTKSNKFNFTFLHYKDIAQIMYLGSQCPESVILNAWEYHEDHRQLTYEYSTKQMDTVQNPNIGPISVAFAERNIDHEMTKVEKIGVTEGMTSD